MKNKITIQERKQLNQDLVTACELGDLEKMKELLKAGAIIRCFQDKSLSIACSNGRLDIVEFILNNVKDPNVLKDDKFLASACYESQIETVKYLVEKGSDINSYSVFRVSLLSENNIIINYLIDQLIENKKEMSQLVLEVCMHGKLEPLKYMANKGVCLTFDNNMPLKETIMYGSFELTKYFILELNADVDTAIKCAKEHNKKYVEDWCIQYLAIKKLNDMLSSELSEQISSSTKKMKV